MNPETLYGPLHSKNSVDIFLKSVSEAVNSGGKVVIGGKVLKILYLIFF